MAEPLIVINGCIDQLSPALPHVTKPAGFHKIPCQKVLHPHGWEQKAKAELCSPFFFKAHWWGAEQWTGAKLGILSLQSILFWFASSFKVQQLNSHVFISFISSFEQKVSQGSISKRKSIPNSTWQFTRVWRKPAQLLLEFMLSFGTKHLHSPWSCSVCGLKNKQWKRCT